MESFLSFLQCNWILFLLFTVPLKMDLFVPRTATFTIQRVRWSCWHADREWCVPSSRQDSYKIICQSNRIYFVLPPSRCERVASTARRRVLVGNRVGEWRDPPVAPTDASIRVRAKCAPPTAADMCLRYRWPSAYLRSAPAATGWKKTAPPSARPTRIPIIMCAAVMDTFTRPLANWTCSTVGKSFVVLTVRHALGYWFGWLIWCCQSATDKFWRNVKELAIAIFGNFKISNIKDN